MSDSDFDEIDYVLTDGKPTWIKTRGSEFYLKDGVWFRHDIMEEVKDVELSEDFRCLSFSLANDISVQWYADGRTVVTQKGITTEYSSEADYWFNPGVWYQDDY